MKDFKKQIQKLSSAEIAELQVEQALRIIAENSNLLADIEAELFDAIGEKGKWTIKVDQLKSLKAMVTEQDRALKTVCQSG
jgi:galactokinase